MWTTRTRRLSKSRAGWHCCRQVPASKPRKRRPSAVFELHFLHHRQRSRTRADHEAPALPGYFLFHGERRVSKGVAEFLGRLLLTLADFSAVDHQDRKSTRLNSSH